MKTAVRVGLAALLVMWLVGDPAGTGSGAAEPAGMPAAPQESVHGSHSGAHDHHGGHQPARPISGMSPEEDLEYSRLMHHSSGWVLILIGALLLADRLTGRRHVSLRLGTGAAWFGLGLYQFLFSDVEAWPLGPAGFIESFSLPTAHEWIQHHLLAMIPMALGLFVLTGGAAKLAPAWNYAAALLAALGGSGLMIHQHLDHPDLDVVNLEHRFFALTSFFIAASLAIETAPTVSWARKVYLLPIGVMLLGLQLAFYVE